MAAQDKREKHKQRKKQASLHQRMCVSCRNFVDPGRMVRLTVNHENNQLICKVPPSFSAESSPPLLSNASLPARRAVGRSAYLCCKSECILPALKGTRLLAALEGRKHKDRRLKRRIAWPLEPQLINLLLSKCAEGQKTCHNTQGEENCE